jgi:hypothetical protein
MVGRRAKAVVVRRGTKWEEMNRASFADLDYALHE